MIEVETNIGTVNTQKSALAMLKYYDYIYSEKLIAKIGKSILDTRDPNFIKSRSGIMCNKDFTITTDPKFFTNNIDLFKTSNAIIIDECHMLTEEQINDLFSIDIENDVKIFLYGIGTTYTAEIPKSIQQLIIYSDVVNILPKTKCWCGRYATMNLLVINNSVVKMGSQIVIGDINRNINQEIVYYPVCREHYMKGIYENRC